MLFPSQELRQLTVRNLLRTGVEWLQQQRHANCTEQISVGGVSMLATPPYSDDEIEMGGVKLPAYIRTFIVRKADLSVALVRGLPVLWGGKTYEVCLFEGRCFYYSDPTELEVVILTRET